MKLKDGRGCKAVFGSFGVWHLNLQEISGLSVFPFGRECVKHQWIVYLLSCVSSFARICI
jgi:hypothetical protein